MRGEVILLLGVLDIGVDLWWVGDILEFNRGFFRLGVVFRSFLLS